jgi:hypothetical protein
MNIFFNIIVFLFLSLSVAYMWSHADIFSTTRKFIIKVPYIRRPLLCPECFSFWAGFGVSFLYNPLASITFAIVSNIFCGLITHLAAATLYKHDILKG